MSPRYFCPDAEADAVVEPEVEEVEPEVVASVDTVEETISILTLVDVLDA